MRIKIKVQSYSNIITNSSSEIFCQIQGENLKDIEVYLNSIGCKCEMDDWDGNGDTIDFWIELGEHGTTTERFVALLDKVLSDKFGKNNYKIETDVPL